MIAARLERRVFPCVRLDVLPEATEIGVNVLSGHVLDGRHGVCGARRQIDGSGKEAACLAGEFDDDVARLGLREAVRVGDPVAHPRAKRRFRRQGRGCPVFEDQRLRHLPCEAQSACARHEPVGADGE